MVDDEGFVLGRPSTVAEGEGLYLTNDEARMLRAYLLNEADHIDGDTLDVLFEKIATHIFSELE